MAFKLYSTDDGHVPAWEYLPAENFQPKVGLGLAFAANGKLNISTTPTHICMRREDDYLAPNSLIPVVKITDGQVWESRLSADASAAKPGLKADVASGALLVDAASTTNANFLITYLEGTARNSIVRGRFI